jgi:hypothetical protein
VDARDERVARNEAMFRTVNRELEQASREAGGDADDQLEILCECGQEGCSEMLTLTISDYDQSHGQRDRFVILPGHEDSDLERIVTRKEHYVIVDKFGEAEEIVEAEEGPEGAK